MVIHIIYARFIKTIFSTFILLICNRLCTELQEGKLYFLQVKYLRGIKGNFKIFALFLR